MAEKQVRIPSGSKMGSNFPPIEVLEIGQPGLPGELIIHNGRLWVYGAGGETLIEGGLIQTDAILAGSITADKLTIGSQQFSHSVVWSAIDEDTINWSAGTIKLANGEELPIHAGTASAMFDQLSSGPLSPATTGVDTSVGTVDWVDDENVMVNDNDYAAAQFADTDNLITYYLKAHNFGFNISSDMRIFGIKVEVEMVQDMVLFDDYAIEHLVRIVKNNIIRSVNKSTGDIVPLSPEYVTYGDQSDLWGEFWTPADINNSGFGVALAFQGVPDGSNIDNIIDIDHIRITVYYGKPAYIYFDGTPTLKVTTDQTEVVGDERILLAILEKGGSGGKIIITPINSGGTTIDGSKIVTGRIQSTDGRTYFDLNAGRLIVFDGTEEVILIGKKSI